MSSDVSREGASPAEGALARGMHAAGFAALALTAVDVCMVQAQYRALPVWLALLVLVPVAATLLLHDRAGSAVTAACHLLVGGLALFAFVALGAQRMPLAGAAGIASLPKIALVSVGAGSRPGTMALWAVAGYFVGEGAARLGSGEPGDIRPDLGALSALLAVVALLAIVAGQRRTAERRLAVFMRAVREERLESATRQLELRAAALLHDTALGHLSVIASSPPGPLRPGFAEWAERDLHRLVHEDWLVDDDSDVAGPVAASLLRSALEEVSAAGLDVTLSGDESLLTALPSRQQRALVLATTQCLVNVLEHAEVNEAEVVIYRDGAAVSIMVVDSGRGFSVAEMQPDRLGLQQSVQGRLQSVGGVAKIWSAPGQGTSVMLTVPVGSPGESATGTPPATRGDA